MHGISTHTLAISDFSKCFYRQIKIFQKEESEPYIKQIKQMELKMTMGRPARDPNWTWAEVLFHQAENTE